MKKEEPPRTYFQGTREYQKAYDEKMSELGLVKLCGKMPRNRSWYAYLPEALAHPLVTHSSLLWVK